MPRDEAYYGDPGTYYSIPVASTSRSLWIPELLSVKTRVEEATPGVGYSNYVCRGWATTPSSAISTRREDSVGLHADAEPEMGPVIASVSLAAERLFRLKGRNGAIVFSGTAAPGSLLIMAGTASTTPSTRSQKIRALFSAD